MIDINHSRCGQCFGCAASCHAIAIYLSPEKHVLEVTTDCNKCGVCLKVCPVGAIDLRE
ncbi:MAG: ATP-binding protein [Candidatus Hodarchaeales archaeon]